jgi:hypothetical protein
VVRLSYIAIELVLEPFEGRERALVAASFDVLNVQVERSANLSESLTIGRAPLA